jgi:hypothetical protein
MQRFSSCIPELYVVHSRDIELAVIPMVVRDVMTESKYNVFISNDPLIQQYSQLFKGFFHLQPSGESSRAVTTNAYFAHLYEKQKYAVKNPEELKTHDSYIPLYLNLIGDGGLPMIENYKTKKAIDLINKVKKNHNLFNDYQVVLDFGISQESIDLMVARYPLYSVLSHFNMLEEEDVLSIQRQMADANKVSRSDFDHYNTTAFENRVDVVTLFM